ncbi:MAG: small subunit ribosomal protein [Patescibacteria group bacterium]|jgi:small subunit ribosomal protein S7|nr:small subunit ribosomal protein [Patescibacteria group bacterium]
MPRKVTKSLKRTIKPDRVYKNVLISKTINKVMQDGKKQTAERLVYSALEAAAVKAKVDPVEVLDTAVKNVSPNVMVKSKRIGGANYQVPMEVRGDRKIHYALIWILDSARSKSGQSFDKSLANELLNAFNNEGEAMKKKQDAHQMAEANKAFAHFARY